MYRTLSAPILVQWEVTPSCNHNCIHCYNYWRIGPPPPSLPKNYLELYTKITDEIISNQVFFVVVTGGEPLIVFKRIASFIKKLTKAGVGVSLNSNLTLMTPEMATLLLDCGVKSVLTSLPSGVAENCEKITNCPGCLERIVSGIQVAIEAGIRVSANMVVSKLNYKDVEQTAILSQSLGIGDLSITRASNPIPNSSFAEQTLTLDEFRTLQGEIVKYKEKYPFKFTSLEAISLCAYGDEFLSHSTRTCSAGKSSCAIGMDGDIRSCIRLEESFGHISDGLSPAWQMMSGARDDSWVPDVCKPCKLKNRCGGGCKADAIVATGSMKNPDPLCDLNNIPTFKPTEIPTINSDTFKVTRRLRKRTEAFGTIALFSTARWVVVSNKVSDLLVPDGSIRIDDLAVAIDGTKEEARETASFLAYKEILK